MIGNNIADLRGGSGNRYTGHVPIKSSGSALSPAID